MERLRAAEKERVLSNRIQPAVIFSAQRAKKTKSGHFYELEL